MLANADAETLQVWECFHLAINGNGFGGLIADYAVINDYCRTYSFDSIEVLRIIKAMAGEFGRKRK